MESLRDGDDLLSTDKVEKHKLHTRDRILKFVVRNVAFDVFALFEQIKSTCRGHVEKTGKKVEFGSKASVIQPGVEIIYDGFEWRLESLH